MRQTNDHLIKLPIIFILIVCIFASTSTAIAQANITWAQPQTIPGLKDSGLYPALVSDKLGRLHVFNSQPSGENLSIYYTNWRADRGWINFVDILRAPRGDARIFGAHLDQQGEMHLLFWGGDDLGADMFYTKAPVEDVAKSTEWEDPILIGESAITPSVADLVGDTDFLVAVYSGNLRGNGLYAIQSLDGGKTWDSPKPIFLTNNELLWPTALNLHIDQNGQVYAVWSVVDQTGNGQAIIFSKLDKNHQQWSSTKTVVSAINWEADTPSIIKHDSSLILIFHNGFPTTRWMKTSSDEGTTWSAPIRLFEHIGSNGAASLAVDSGNNLHILFGNRFGTPIIHGAWHAWWLGERWSQAESIISGPRISVDPNGEEGFDPSFLQSVVIQGNLLFVVWRHDPGASPTSIWFTYKNLDTPAEPSTPYPIASEEAPTLIFQPPEETSIVPISTLPFSEMDAATNNETTNSEPQTSNANFNIIIGILPIVFLVIIIIIIRMQRR